MHIDVDLSTSIIKQVAKTFEERSSNFHHLQKYLTQLKYIEKTHLAKLTCIEKLNLVLWAKVFKNGPSEICGRQSLI